MKKLELINKILSLNPKAIREELNMLSSEHLEEIAAYWSNQAKVS